MNKAEVLENGYWIEISIDAYAQKLRVYHEMNTHHYVVSHARNLSMIAD